MKSLPVDPEPPSMIDFFREKRKRRRSTPRWSHHRPAISLASLSMAVNTGIMYDASQCSQMRTSTSQRRGSSMKCNELRKKVSCRVELVMAVILIRVSTVESQTMTDSPTSSPPTTLAPPTQYPSQPVSGTPYPTAKPVSFEMKHYREVFEVAATEIEDAFFTTNQTIAMEKLFTSYTAFFAPEEDNIENVTSLCLFASQGVSLAGNTTTEFINSVDYTCQYLSFQYNVSNYTTLFLIYINSHLDNVTKDLIDLGLPVLNSEPTTMIIVSTIEPSASFVPSDSPSHFPTRSPMPTLFPSASPSNAPSETPTQEFILQPSLPPTNGGSKSPFISVAGIASIVVFSSVIILVGLIWYSRKLRTQARINMLQRRNDEDATAAASMSHDMPPPPGFYRPYEAAGDAMSSFVFEKELSGLHKDGMSHSGSLMSNKSLLSDGGSNIDEHSSDEMDGTIHLRDEFDEYKDQNLEQLRSDVEGNLTGFEGIMSAAVTNALMRVDETQTAPIDVLWGCQERPNGAEVEASALCEVCDWLKRNENEPEERKREFMQEVLNKMVASVRNGVLDPEDASRTVHEAAALLELELANELPSTTVIVSGMRMSIEASVITSVLDDFGDIDVCAVASGERGFAIVRFRQQWAVEKALRQYREEEIVIENVAIQMKVLTASGEILSRA